MNWYTNAHTNLLFTHTHAIHKHVHSHNHHAYIHITMSTQDGYFPLYVASQNDHYRVVEKLLQAGATVDLQNKVENRVLVSIVV